MSDSEADDLDPTDLAAARFADAAIALHEGDLAAAAGHANAALAMFRAASGDDHPDVGNSLTLLSRIERTRSEYPAALVHARAAMAILDAARLEYPEEEIV